MKRKKNSTWKIIALLVMTFVFAKFQGGFVSWFLFYSCVTFACYLAVTYFLMFTTIEVSRELDRERLQDGDDLIISLHIRRRVWFPFGWNIIVEALPEKLVSYYEPHRKLIFPGWKRNFTIQYVVPSLPRGHYVLGDISISGGDYFGFVKRSRTFPLHSEFLVYPSHRELTHWPTGHGRMSGTMNTSNRRSDDLAAVRGVRDYQRGDKMSQIHWRASSRGVGLKTKEYEHQAVNQFLFFLDVEKQHYSSKRPDLFETSVKLAASLLYYTSRRSYPFGFVANHNDMNRIVPGNSQYHFFRVFDQLARVMPEGQKSFAHVVNREALELPKGFTIVVITPVVTNALMMTMIQLTQSGRIVHLFWVNESSLLTMQENKVLQLLAANKVICKMVSVDEYERMQRIGGA